MKNKHIYPSLRLNEEEFLELNAQEQEIRCLDCGVKEVGEWANEGPVAPAVSSEMLARVKRKQSPEWQGYIYKIAAGFAVLFLVLQLGKHQGIVTSDDPREAAHFLVDSARNDTAFLLKENPSEDTVKAVSFINEGVELEEGELLELQSLTLLNTAPGRDATSENHFGRIYSTQKLPYEDEPSEGLEAEEKGVNSRETVRITSIA